MGSRGESASFARRYQRVGAMGRGATGTVHRALDRLTTRHVALKMLADGPPLEAMASEVHSLGAAATSDLFAREFRLLSSLHHPNVIASLDYGFDENEHPFFTMDLQEGAQTLREAAVGQPLAAQVGLIVQLLHALAYLHRRGFVHRDVKPDNALCVDGVVKLIDFGLAAPPGDDDDGACGTLAYTAPEVLRGAPARESSDLYAVGVIAYEIFVGRHPFDVSSRASLLRSIFQSTPDFATSGLDPRLVEVLHRLLAREPAARFGTAFEVIDALSGALGVPFPLETASTRESFLHGAELVGREAELARLRSSLPFGPRDDHAAVLLAGESGVGKSRLLDELAVEAMVGGVRVLRGQALREGARPYEPWRGVFEQLVFVTAPTDLEASVLLPVVPHIHALLARPVTNAPEIDPEATHVRLARVVEALLRRCREPILIVLEDLQWAGRESLKLFARVQALTSELRLSLVGAYRSEERQLASELPGAETLELRDLPTAAIERLCASVVGREDGAETPSGLVELVARESHGNVFLALEIMRALADEAGGIHAISASAPPRLPGGVEHLVDRRVDRLSEEERALLRTAAVAGRELSLELLGTIHPGLDPHACALRAVEAGLLSSVQGRFWFAHDKLREALLAALPGAERRSLHKHLADAICTLTPDRAPALAYHFGAAGETAREQTFAALAGDQFLRSGAYHDAIPFLRRAATLLTSKRPLDRASLQRKLGEALFRSGQLMEARASLGDCLSTLGRPLPAGPRVGLGIAREACQQLALRARRGRGAPPSASDVVRFEEAILAYTQLSRLAHHLNDENLVLYVTLSALNLAERGRLAKHHARLASVMGAVMGLAPVHRWARFYFELARDLGAGTHDTSVDAFVLAHEGYYEAGIGAWASCEAKLERSMTLYETIGDVRLWEESVSILAYACFYQGNPRRSLDLYRALERSGEERVDGQIISWGLTNRLKLMARSGTLGGIDALLQRADGLLIDGITKSVRDGVRIELDLARGDHAAARLAAEETAASLKRSPPRSFMVCSTYAAVAEALLVDAADSSRPHVERRRLQKAASHAVRALAGVARIFPIAEPARLLHAGSLEALRDRPARAQALWLQAAKLAAARELPYEEACARRALARSGRGDSAAQLERARTLLDRLGTAPAHRAAL